MPIIQGGEEKISRGAMVTTTGYNCYSDGTVNNPNMQTSQFQQGFHESTNPAEIYNLTTGMDQMIGGFSSSKNITTANLQHTNSVIWKEFFGKSAVSNHNLHHHHHQVDAASSSKINNGQFHQQDFSTGISDMVRQDHHQSSSAAWHHHDINRSSSVLVDDPSLRVVFPCEGNERPSQGLSLSLGSSNNPSAIGLQSFELRLPHDDMRNDGQFFGKVSLNIQQQQQQEQMMQDGFLGKVANLHHQGQQFHMRNSKYLAPAQELLSEFCNLGTKQIDSTSKLKLHKTNQWLQDDQDNNASSSSKMQSLYSLDLLELQKRKAKLLQMLEEVDRRYKHYCHQMKAVVSSFEAAAGNGAATVYSALASKAMSRHFRCLRDGIVGQIKATKKALGEKDTSIPGATKGETPRLKILDQALRQQKAFQQTNMMESHPWRPQRGLPERAVSVLRAWLFEHFLYPYPSDVDKHVLARQTGLSRSQVSNWFINARVRLWKPMVEEMYTQETKEEEEADDTNIDGGISSAKGGLDDHHDQDQKPTPDKLARIDSECLSSIINNNPPEKNHNMQHNIQQHSFGRVSDSFGAMELDFSSYNHQSYAGGGGGSGGGGVSLTLGLQQHIGGGGGGSGVSLAFSSPSQSSLFYTREHIEDCQQVEYSLLDSDQGQNLPYRDLMGAQLLHDLVG